MFSVEMVWVNPWSLGPLELFKSHRLTGVKLTPDKDSRMMIVSLKDQYRFSMILVPTFLK